MELFAFIKKQKAQGSVTGFKKKKSFETFAVIAC